ncbi:hypothetical protein OG994_01430 [Micromonospora globbae]|uniref:Integral membrane protein n=1 Tax=Micromonospora globbae TaxID=1894969 RepID=A0ABZ1S8B5_9ACTN|nr:hypothetical protein [Micromonospora globbae]
MSDLERRYLRLLRAYPADYRRARGAEIVGTYLDLADPDRRWPSVADAADLLRGGLRQRLRAAGAADLLPGVRLAALIALPAATGVAGVWASAEIAAPSVDWVAFGPFATVGVACWLAWLLTAVVAAVAPVRWTRVAVGLALAVTVAVVPVSAAAGLPRPPLFVLLPQVVLGLLALALPTDGGWWLRLPPLAAGATAAATTTHGLGDWSYRWGDPGTALTTSAPALLVVAMLIAVARVLADDRRGLWAMLLLVAPGGLLALRPLAFLTGKASGWNPQDDVTFAVTAGGVVALNLAVLWLALAAGRAARHRGRRPAGLPPTAHTCPTCGSPR